jgi:hypothetical protein
MCQGLKHRRRADWPIHVNGLLVTFCSEPTNICLSRCYVNWDFTEQCLLAKVHMEVFLVQSHIAIKRKVRGSIFRQSCTRNLKTIWATDWNCTEQFGCANVTMQNLVVQLRRARQQAVCVSILYWLYVKHWVSLPSSSCATQQWWVPGARIHAWIMTRSLATLKGGCGVGKVHRRYYCQKQQARRTEVNERGYTGKATHTHKHVHCKICAKSSYQLYELEFYPTGIQYWWVTRNSVQWYTCPRFIMTWWYNPYSSSP